ncbi:MAG: hypothetical protein R2764_26075, partial [Bacteroidales bacterium]
MKKLTNLIVAFFLTFSSFAQTPGTFNYQAVIRDAAGGMLVNEEVTLTISILEGENSTLIYSEDWNVETNSFGLVNLEIGSKDSETFKSIRWMNGPYYLSLNVNGEFLGTSPLLSVPFAQLAQRVVEGGADDADADPTNEIELPAQDGNSGKYLTSDGTNPAWGTISFNSLTDIPFYLDKDVTDDFSGYYGDLLNKPITISPAQATAIKAHSDSLHIIDTKLTTDSTLLRGLIDQEIADRTADVNAEETARIGADANLTAKAKSDSTVFRNEIDTEKATRLAADLSINAKMNADSTLLRGMIHLEITDRTADVDAEEAARIAADAILAAKAKSDSTVFRNDIDAEEASRIAADLA